MKLFAHALIIGLALAISGCGDSTTNNQDKSTLEGLGKVSVELINKKDVDGLNALFINVDQGLALFEMTGKEVTDEIRAMTEDAEEKRLRNLSEKVNRFHSFTNEKKVEFEKIEFPPVTSSIENKAELKNNIAIFLKDSEGNRYKWIFQKAVKLKGNWHWFKFAPFDPSEI